MRLAVVAAALPGFLLPAAGLRLQPAPEETLVAAGNGSGLAAACNLLNKSTAANLLKWSRYKISRNATDMMDLNRDGEVDANEMAAACMYLVDEPVEGAAAEAAPAVPGNDLWLQLALQELVNRTEDGPVCIAAAGEFMGRLSNTVSMMNIVLNAAVHSTKHFNAPVEYKFPRRYTGWMQKEHLNHIFGEEPRCEKRATKFYMTTCTEDRLKKGADGRMRCDVPDMVVNTAAPTTRMADLCGCGQMVLVPTEGMLWDHKYEKTREAFMKRYWQSQNATMVVPGSEGGLVVPGAFPKQAVMHVRLGDVEDPQECARRFTAYNCRKRLRADHYVQTMKALLEVLPPQCFQMHIVTDGRPDSPDIQNITQELQGAGLEAPKVWISPTLDAATTFHFMTHADILIYGSSGFGQLAAVLAKNETVRIGSPQPIGYQTDPFYYMPNTTQMRNTSSGDFDLKKARARFAKNEALKAYAEACAQHQKS